MTVRCPFCRAAPLGDPTACARCGAPTHAACALELGRCAACGGPVPLPAGTTSYEGWTARRVGRGREAFVAAAPPAPPPPGARVRLRLHLESDRVASEGLLAGEARLGLPRATRLGRLRLVLGEEPPPGLLARLRTRRARPRWVELFDAGGGRVAPGIYGVAFRVPADLLPPERARATLELERPGDPLRAALPLAVGSHRVEASGGDRLLSWRGEDRIR